MSKKILFPTDFSESSKRALKHAVAIASQMKAKLHLMHVVFPEVEALDVPVMSDKATQARIESAKAVMDSFSEYGHSFAKAENPVEFKSSVQMGIPGKTITRMAEEQEYDMIIMASRSEHGILDRLFGSVSSSVAIHATCPVLLIPDQCEINNFSNLLYATDYQESDPYHILNLVDLLGPIGKVMRCVHVKKYSEEEDKAVDLQKLRTVFKNQIPSIEMTFHEWEAESTLKGIMEFSDIYEVDVIAVLVKKKSFLEGLFHISEAKSLSMKTPVPLLVLHEK